MVWTPADNASLKSRDKGAQLFPSKGGFIGLIAEVKEPTDSASSIITLEAMQELKIFVDKMPGVSASINGTNVTWG